MYEESIEIASVFGQYAKVPLLFRLKRVIQLKFLALCSSLYYDNAT